MSPIFLYFVNLGYIIFCYYLYYSKFFNVKKYLIAEFLVSLCINYHVNTYNLFITV